MADEKEMTFLEHLEEMRGVILRCVGVFVIALIGVLIGFHYFNSLMMYPLNSAKRIIAMWVEPSPEDIKAQDQKLGPVFLVGADDKGAGQQAKQGPFYIVPTQDGIVLKPQKDAGSDWYNAIKLRSMTFATPLIVWFYVGFLGAVGFSLPIMLYFVARFIAPGLKPEELKMLRPGMIAGVILFALGAVFGFAFILPMGIAFMSYMSQSMGLEMFPDAQSYYSMVIFVTLAIGMTFQLPLLVVILIYLGVLDVAWLKKNRKIIFFGILIFATIVTPPDVLTQVSITIPLYLMYEVAVIVGERMRKRKLRQEQLEELRMQEEDERERKEYAQMVARERLAEEREEEENTSDIETELQIDKSVYTRDSADNYEDYPYDPYNYDNDNYDPDNDPYLPKPYIDYGRAARHVPDFAPNWDLNRQDTSFMTPDWTLNAPEEQTEAGRDGLSAGQSTEDPAEAQTPEEEVSGNAGGTGGTEEPAQSDGNLPYSPPASAEPEGGEKKPSDNGAGDGSADAGQMGQDGKAAKK